MTRTDPAGAARTGQFRVVAYRLARETAARLTLRWEIAAAALAESTLARGEAPFIHLEWNIPLPVGPGPVDGREEARAELVNPRTGERALLAVVAAGPDDLAGPVRCSREQDLRHIEIDGLLSATVRIGPAPEGEPAEALVTLLYARTTLLGQLGIPGGRYELAGASLQPA